VQDASAYSAPRRVLCICWLVNLRRKQKGSSRTWV